MKVADCQQRTPTWRSESALDFSVRYHVQDNVLPDGAI